MSMISRPEYRSAASRAAQKERRRLLKEITEIEVEIKEGLSDMEDDFVDETLPALRRDRRLLIKQFDELVTRCEKAELRNLSGVTFSFFTPELRQIIYEYLCCNNDVVIIPNRNHEFFHEFETSDMMSYKGSGECGSSLDKPAEDDEIKYELAKQRNQVIFNAQWVGSDMAKEITKTFLEKNQFQFCDARCYMREFLHTRFPCGYIPRDYVRDIVIYVRCEDFLEWAGWDKWGYGGDMAFEPEEDFEWEERGVYEKISKQISFIRDIKFKKKSKVTLVIVTPFGRWGADYVEEDRVALNFQDAILPVYSYLKKNTSSVKVICKRIGDVKRTRELEYTEDDDVTWQVQLALEEGAESTLWREHFAYPNGVKKTPQRLRLEKLIKAGLEQRAKQKSDSVT